MQSLTLDISNQIIQIAITKARELKLAPLTVVVLDQAGHLKAMQREDGATELRQKIAIAKAWGAINMGMSSRRLADIATQRKDFMEALIGLADGKIMPVPGGVLIRDTGNQVLGAVGISGDRSDQDESCAILAIQALGLIADA